jgi:hypothetical protein
MADPLGGAIGDPRVPTTYVGDVDGAPLGGPVSIRCLKMYCDLCR